MRSRVAVHVEQRIVPEQAPWRLRPCAAHAAVRVTICALQGGSGYAVAMTDVQRFWHARDLSASFQARLVNIDIAIGPCQSWEVSGTATLQPHSGFRISAGDLTRSVPPNHNKYEKRSIGPDEVL